MRHHSHHHHEVEEGERGRRHRGGPGEGDFMFGGPRGPFGYGGPFEPGRGGSRRRRGDVRLAMLLLLKAEGAANGYQLMQGLEQRSEGRWRPSPGSVYPALSQLEDEGLIRSTQREGESGRSFELTDAGIAHLEQYGEHKPPWEADEGDADNPRMALRNAMIATGKAAWQVAHDGDAEQTARAVEILAETRKALYRLLAGDTE